MSRISITFFATAVVYALAGMVLGSVMGASGDHLMAPLHAHINLLGWASLAIMGGFYALAGERTPTRLAWANYAVSNLGNLLMFPMLALISQGKPPIGPVIAAGDMLVILGMVLFGVAVLTVGRRSAAAA